MKGKTKLLIPLNNVNPNGENIITKNLNHANFLFLKNINIDLKNKHHMLFFPKDVKTARKTKLLKLFTSLMNIE
jgi:hypothetical protein